ncbi:hypothetical protein ACSVH2_07205 [Flavobacterium sp. RSB2_4_14]|uniref:hypothetical protein n=1 Tax=Flavobacterium sp. RSB2_4_14 TaxID=3447665 RepID=UPI003F3CEF77
MKIEINNYTDLLEFIKRGDVTVKQATQIVCKCLKVLVIFEMTKENLIKETEYHINTFCNNGQFERPIFLGQLELDVNIKDIFKAKN